YTDDHGTQFLYYRHPNGQLMSEASSWHDATHPTTLIGSITYNALGQVSTFNYGDGIPRAYQYDNRGRLYNIADGTGSPWTYGLTLGYAANSRVSSYSDTVVGLYNYTYDAFNRLATTTNSVGSYSYSY